MAIALEQFKGALIHALMEHDFIVLYPINPLAFKWIRIMFRCWKDRVPYDEIRYLKALQKRGSPFLKLIAEPQPEPA